jgi:phenylalanine-4-hydroxylase
MKTYKMLDNMNQDYSLYTTEDFLVWKTLFNRQMPILEELASYEYLAGLKQVRFTGERIPDFKEVNQILGDLTGWTLVVVPGIINEEDFFSLLSQKKFPATTWLRKFSQLDYLPEPDMFHDVFAHVPLLSNAKFCEFFQTIGLLGVEHRQFPDVLAMLGRLYWFTVEFGLIRSDEKLKIYGAGILSSHGETKFSVSNEPTHLNFDVEVIMNTEFENDKIQNKYFVIGSFDDLYHSIGTIKTIVEKTVKRQVLLN